MPDFNYNWDHASINALSEEMTVTRQFRWACQF